MIMDLLGADYSMDEIRDVISVPHPNEEVYMVKHVV